MTRLLRGSTHEVIARLSGLALAAILVASAAAYEIAHNGLLDRGREYHALFADAWPLVAGMDVRVSGIVAGSVRQVELTDRGTARVTFQLRPGVPVPRADASAAIVQDDLLGDSSLYVELGHARRPLSGAIPVARTIQEPRLDDFLDIFRRPVRAALQAFIVEYGTAMRARGIDVNRAILALRPAFEALGGVLAELRSQNRAMGQVVEQAQTVAAQLAGRSGSLDRLVTGLEQTVSGVAARAPALDADLAQLPATLSETDGALRDARELTGAVAPLARTVVRAAPQLQPIAVGARPYIADLARAARVSAPTIRLAAAVLRAGAPTLAALSRVGVAGMLNPTGSLFASLSPVLSRTADGVFGTNSGGGLGGAAVPGNDLTSPTADPARDYLSVFVTITCEAFNLPQEPGCLQKALTLLGANSPAMRRPVRSDTPPALARRPAPSRKAWAPPPPPPPAGPPPACRSTPGGTPRHAPGKTGPMAPPSRPR